jgi:hypothetical protein
MSQLQSQNQKTKYKIKNKTIHQVQTILILLLLMIISIIPLQSKCMLRIYIRGDHNAAREPHAARGGFWCGSPLTEGAAPNRQEILQ